MTLKDNVNAINEMSNKGFERLNRLGELHLSVWERLASRQMEAVNLMLEQGARQMRLVSEAKGYSELVRGQMELAKETGERLMAETKTNIALAGEVRDQYRTWFQSGVTEFTAELRKGATAA